MSSDSTSIMSPARLGSTGHSRSTARPWEVAGTEESFLFPQITELFTLYVFMRWLASGFLEVVAM